jgi:hypothetical protein
MLLVVLNVVINGILHLFSSCSDFHGPLPVRAVLSEEGIKRKIFVENEYDRTALPFAPYTFTNSSNTVKKKHGITDDEKYNMQKNVR